MQFTAQQIAAVVHGEVIGDGQVAVADVSPIEAARKGTLCFLGDEKYLPYLATTEASIVLMSRGISYEEALSQRENVVEGSSSAAPTLILVDNARGAMASLLAMVQEVLCPKKKGIEQPCFIAEGVNIPEDAYVGAFSYIGKGAQIGAGAQIYPQCYVGDNVKIGEETILYAGVRIYYNCVIGRRCILHSGAVIGADGFGFEPDAQGVLQKVPQIGNVVLGDDIEVGANTCIDRAMMGSTHVSDGSKLDNLVQVGHNVQVGSQTMMCAQVGVAGSTEVGSHCILAGQVGVAGHIKIADGSIFGAQSGVAGNIRQKGVYMGSPAIDAAVWRRSSAAFKSLPEMLRIVYRLDKNK